MGPRTRVKEMIKNETGSEGKTRSYQRRERERASWVLRKWWFRLFDKSVWHRKGVPFLVFRDENAKSLDILDTPFHENIYQVVITELLSSHSCVITLRWNESWDRFLVHPVFPPLPLFPRYDFTSDFPIPFSTSIQFELNVKRIECDSC